MAEWTRVRELFDAALDIDPAERERFLDSECAGDAELRRQVDELIAADSATYGGAAIEKPLPGDVVEAELTEAVAGQSIGGYRIERVLGSGGMSTVFLAVQENPRREVALKTMRAGLFASDARRRFEYESEILARLRHPAIAQVYEAGTWKEPLAGQEVPFFVMEYVKDAVPFDRYVRDASLPLEQALELFTQVCDAVHYGHGLGVIHRDLKPANVLVDGDGRPKVIDFGIARATEADVQELSMLTRTGHVLGTLRYMAPEQLDGNRDEVDTRIDVYALGVMLYEMLAGTPLVDPGTLSLTAFAKRVREMEPPLPSRSARGFELSGYARDLDWVTRKALATQRDERYRSVSELAADIRRLTAHEPVSVGPPSTVYYQRKFVRRNRILVGGIAAAFVILIAGVVTTTWQMVRAERSAETARLEAIKAHAINGFFNDLLKFADPNEGRYRSRPDWTVREALDAAAEFFPRLQDQPEAEAQVRVSIADAYKSLGQLDKAEEYATRAVELRRKHLGAEHADVAAALLSLGATQIAQARYEDALATMRDALVIFQKSFGDEHEKVGLCRLNIGTCLIHTKKPGEGQVEIAAAVGTFRRLDPVRHRFVAICLHHLGLLAAGRNEIENAIALLRESIDEFAKANKSWHPYAGVAHDTLAQLLEKQKQLTAARKHYEEANRIIEAAWGAHTEHALKSRFNIANFLRGIGHREAELVHRRAIITIQSKLRGADSPIVGKALFVAADLLAQLGRFAEAEPIYRDSLAIYEKAETGRSWNTISVRARFVNVFRGQKKNDQALEQARRGYEDAVALGGEAHQRVRAVASEFAKCLRDAKRFDEAEQLLRKRLAIEIRAKSGIQIHLARNQLATVLTVAGKLEAAREVFAELSRDPPPLPQGHWMHSVFRRAHGVFLGKDRQFEKGEAELLAAMAGFRAATSATHPNVRMCRENLAELYEAWGKTAEAAKFRAPSPEAGTRK